MFGNRSSVWKGSIMVVRIIYILSGNRSTVRVYPHHNDVRVWKLWEAVVCLSKYLIQHPEAVRGPSIMEVGSGVGLTVLVVAVLCRPIRVSLTYFTDACLTNIAHNVEVVNQDWLEGRGVVMGKGGALMTVRNPRGFSKCPLFKSMVPHVCLYLPPRSPPQY